MDTAPQRACAASMQEAKAIVIMAMKRAGHFRTQEGESYLNSLLDGFAVDIRWIDRPNRPEEVNRALTGEMSDEARQSYNEREILHAAIAKTRKDVENGFRRSRAREIAQRMGREMAEKIVETLYGPSPE